MANYPAMTNQQPLDDGSTDHVLEVFEDLRKHLEELHVPEFLNIEVTMSQAKILRLLENEGELHMSELVRRLGISLSTVSGHLDRLVEQGLVVRGDDPAHRRQVLVAPTPAAYELVERFRELNTAQLRSLLELMNREERLDVVRAFGHITRMVQAFKPTADKEGKGAAR
jgi:DNA-binding MarR family transcriptional regulator